MTFLTLDILSARDAGLCWMNTDLPLKQVCITPPNLPVHNPFLNWAPETIALAPTGPSNPDIAPVRAEENEEVVENEIDDGAQELPVDHSPLPFRMGPTPPLVKSVVPVGEVKRGYPRGDITQLKRVHQDFSDYTGPEMYIWPQVVSISRLNQLILLLPIIFRTIWISDLTHGFLMIRVNGFIKIVSTLFDSLMTIFQSFVLNLDMP